jgi:hypothetical protein
MQGLGVNPRSELFSSKCLHGPSCFGSAVQYVHKPHVKHCFTGSFALQNYTVKITGYYTSLYSMPQPGQVFFHLLTVCATPVVV